MFDDDEEDGIDLPSNVRSTQRVAMTPPPPPKREIEDVVFVDVEGNPSETESPQAGTKRKADSPPHVPVPQVVSVSVPTIRSASVEEDSNPVKLKIKVRPILKILSVSYYSVTSDGQVLTTVELQWLKHLWDHENWFETGVV